MDNTPVKQDYGMVNFEEYAMDMSAVSRQVNIIQELMKKVMHNEEHYGVVPGCKKPSLFKAGAEKLSLVFRLRPEYETIMRELKGGHREYEIKCTLYHIPTGQSVGQGVGSCSTMEGKYRFRKGELSCPECGKETIIKGKQEFGGGWICYQKKGGCGKKWTDADNPFAGVSVDKVEHDNPADYYNTVLKMAKKRAHIDAILTATAASDIFTQDLEDPPENGNHEPDRPPIREPQRKQSQKKNQSKPSDNGNATQPQINAINAILTKQGAADEMAICEHVSDMLGKELISSLSALTKAEASQVIEELNKK